MRVFGRRDSSVDEPSILVIERSPQPIARTCKEYRMEFDSGLGSDLMKQMEDVDQGRRDTIKEQGPVAT